MKKNLCPKAYVIGDPIAHSLSPLLHQTWLAEKNQPGSYEALQVKKTHLIPVLTRLFSKEDVKGINITLPHKTSVLAFADEISPLARRCNAANLLYRENGKIVAHNTDIDGFLSPLLGQMNKKTLHNQTAFVIGAGGAAKAVLIGLLDAGIEQIYLCNRTDEKARQLCAFFQNVKLSPIPWSQRNDLNFAPDILINASSAGMTGMAALDINLRCTHQKTVIYDLVYAPLQTKLMQAAQAKKLKTIGGLDMLIAQARPCFNMFFNAEPPATNTAKTTLIQALQVRKNRSK